MRYEIKNSDCLEWLKTLPDCSADSCVSDPPAGIGFMGAGWDKDKGGRDKWVEWLASVFTEVKRVLKPGSHCLIWALPRTSHWTMTGLEDAGFEIRDVVSHIFGTGFPKSVDVSKAIDLKLGAERQKVKHKARAAGAGTFSGATDKRPWVEAAIEKGYHETAGSEPVTPEALKWQGYGTALKPACEFWILCRKPLDGTIAGNVLQWGTGGLNLDACRIEASPEDIALAAVPNRAGIKYCEGIGEGRASGSHDMGAGRFPANLICSEPDLMGDKARFFYCPKASRVERNQGLDLLEKKSPKRYRADKGTEEHAPRKLTPEANTHPTVKPQALMRYLVKLVTPAGGVCVDPFMGSGSTGLACLAEGFSFKGSELEKDFYKIAGARLKAFEK